MKQQCFLLLFVLFVCTNCGITKDTANASTQASESSMSESSPTAAAKMASDDILGTWDLKVQTPRGENASVLTIFEEDGQLKGKTDRATFNITRDGNQLNWTSKLDTPMGSMNATNNVVIDGNKLSGTVSVRNRKIQVSGVKRI